MPSYRKEATPAFLCGDITVWKESHKSKSKSSNSLKLAASAGLPMVRQLWHWQQSRWLTVEELESRFPSAKRSMQAFYAGVS